jgi:CheY-like chemotaxis protein
VGGLLEQRADFDIHYAEDGTDALRNMEKQRPDVVVTDLNMPEKNGLELVRAMRVHFAGIPVILITAQGSEALAVGALEEGAASYVPKVLLADRLVDTIDEVLALASAHRSYERLLSSIDHTEFQFTLENDSALFDPLVELFQQFLLGMGLSDDTDRFRVGMAIKEALLNAMYRGNLELSYADTQEDEEQLLQGIESTAAERRKREEPYASRRIHLLVNMKQGEARFVIRDDGPGFDTTHLPKPGDLGSLDPEAGRGIVLMRSFMDEVVFNEKGNEVVLVKRPPKQR